MDTNSDAKEPGPPRKTPITTRRGFIAGASLGAVSLYGLWVAYGAAPLGRDAAETEPAAAPHGGGHNAGHEAPSAPSGDAGHGTMAGPSPEEFRRQAEDFLARHRRPDGSVQPDPGHSAAPVEIYLLAQQWSFDPSVLRLNAGRPYRLRMMAVDVSHGASIQLGRASQIFRLRPGIVVDRLVTFTRPGDYLIYCTVYCGLAHDRMSAKLVVT
jgi:cytochrome c oxidase subunit II